MAQALYRKYRPHLWHEVMGQEHITGTLQNAVQADRVAHAYLFSGPRGTGKTTTARLLAKAVNCLSPDLSLRPCDSCEHCLAVNKGSYLDLIEIDAASNTSVEDVRELRDKINFSPGQGKYKVYIIDEVHMLSTAAFNALLKTLEEPPAHAIFILATTEIHKIPATVLSRCQRHEFRRLPVEDIVRVLQDIVKAESLEADTEALMLIARQSTGSMRDAISLLDQLSSNGTKIDLVLAQTVLGTATNQSVTALTDALIDSDITAGLEIISKALDKGSDPRQYARQVVDYLRNILLIQYKNEEHIDATKDQLSFMKRQAEKFPQGALIQAIRLFNETAVDNRASWQPGLSLELAIAQLITDPFEAQTDSPDKSTEVISKPVAQETKKRQTKTQDVLPERQPVEPVINESRPEAKALSVDDPDTGNQTSQQVQPSTEQKNTEVNLHTINSKWEEIKSFVRKYRKPTEALLNSCKPILIKDNAVYLSFASDTVKILMDKKENLELTSRAIYAITGAEVSVRCIVSKSKTESSTDLLDIDDDGMVNTALNLGGKIVQQD